MMHFTTSRATSLRATIILLGALASTASAHSRITNIVVDGVYYQGYDPKIPDNAEVLVGWGTSVTDDGWVNHESYHTPDIVCHRDAVNAKGYAPVEAGSTIDIQWQGWPESHKGPLLTYLAWCGDENDPAACENINKEDLRFFLIDREGLINPDGVPNDWATATGTWASDEFIANNASWTTRVPSSLPPGHYVLRQELIALHFALDLEMSGPQHYPQCINIAIVGGEPGAAVPRGTLATDLYTLEAVPDPEEEVVVPEGDPGLAYDISISPLEEYVIPGPTLIGGAESAEQTVPEVTSTASAIPADPEIVLERAMRRGNRV